jgi:hypothetical protein
LNPEEALDASRSDPTLRLHEAPVRLADVGHLLADRPIDIRPMLHLVGPKLETEQDNRLADCPGFVECEKLSPKAIASPLFYS